jgi:hypothetical protein
VVGGADCVSELKSRLEVGWETLFEGDPCVCRQKGMSALPGLVTLVVLPFERSLVVVFPAGDKERVSGASSST